MKKLLTALLLVTASAVAAPAAAVGPTDPCGPGAPVLDRASLRSPSGEVVGRVVLSWAPSGTGDACARIRVLAPHAGSGRVRHTFRLTTPGGDSATATSANPARRPIRLASNWQSGDELTVTVVLQNRFYAPGGTTWKARARVSATRP